jgi:geranylgeranyl diphosphate synthase, type II
MVVPQDPAQREELREVVRRYIDEEDLVPPLPLGALRAHAATLRERIGADEECEVFLAVLVSNEVWRSTVAAIPFERRILLLPQCLRSTLHCTADLDEFGLLCAQCDSCSIGAIEAMAAKLGYVVLVAEGTTIVTKLLEQGKVDAVVGVSCLSVLERAFPYMDGDAIPGIAIPLLCDGCEDTQLDFAWVREEIQHRSDETNRRRLGIDDLRSEVDSWFETDPLRRMLGAGETKTEEIGLAWLARGGKRWRPFLATCVQQALSGAGDAPPETTRKLAVAVEAFHKASLVHDDIEDDDDCRYGEMTLHRQYGVPIALNTGDYLLGIGYRLISRSGATPEEIARMLSIAAEGHRDLCLGQGEELYGMHGPRPLSSSKVLDIFEWKTAPAFEVALRIGAVCGGADDETHAVLRRFSKNLGIAYQIRDDLDDFRSEGEDGDVEALRPSLPLALAYENARCPEREAIASAWRKRRRSTSHDGDLVRIIEDLGIPEQLEEVYEAYRTRALGALEPLRQVELKSLLHRVVGRILGRRGKEPTRDDADDHA